MPLPNPFCQSFDQLPPSLPVFPLARTVVLPRGLLPLNIFEPRYINMVQDAMRSNQLIGMIQPADNTGTPNTATPTLHQVGCAGRIVRYEEIPDGRFSILLLGLCRFKITQELDSVRGYRIVSPDWLPYENDYDKAETIAQDAMNHLLTLLKDYVDGKYRVDWSVTENMTNEEIINNSAIYLPLSETEKQFLLEAHTLNERLSVLTALLESNSQKSKTKH